MRDIVKLTQFKGISFKPKSSQHQVLCIKRALAHVKTIEQHI